MRDQDDLAGLLAPLPELSRYQDIATEEVAVELDGRWPLLATPDTRDSAAAASPAHFIEGRASGSSESRAYPAGRPTAAVALAASAPSTPRRFARLPSPGSKTSGPLVLGVMGHKGGVGCTTVAANLAAALAYGGYSVVALDLDGQNGLRHHFGLDPRDVSGWASAMSAGASWTNARCSAASLRPVLVNAPDLTVLPHGTVHDDEQQAIDFRIDADPAWLHRQLQGLALHDGTVVVIDLPSYSTPVMRQALGQVHVLLSVLGPDATALVGMERIERLVGRYCAVRADFHGHRYAVNQVDHARRLAHDACRLLKSRCGDLLVAQVHRDQSMAEALACGMPALDYSPSSQAVRDLLECAGEMAQLLSGATVPGSTAQHRRAA